MGAVQPALRSRRIGLSDRTSRHGLAWWMSLAMCGVAAVAVVIAGLVAANLVRNAAEQQALQTLGRQTGIVADLVNRTGPACCGRRQRPPAGCSSSRERGSRP